MSSLIVDFIPNREAGHKAKTLSSVQFSSKIDIRFFERQDEATIRDTHCSREDYRKFKRHTQRAVQDVHRRFQLFQQSAFDAGGDDANALHQEWELCGIENLLTPELVRKTQLRKEACINAVLDEQERQDAQGCADPERLARASLRYSRWAMQRSVKIGMMQELM